MVDLVLPVKAVSLPPNNCYVRGDSPCRTVSSPGPWPGQETCVATAVTGKGKRPKALNQRPPTTTNGLNQVINANVEWTRTSTYAAPLIYDPNGEFRHEPPLKLSRRMDNRSRREAFEAAKKEGRIYVNPDQRYRATVWDDPRIDSYSSRTIGTSRRGCDELGQLYTEVRGQCISLGYLTPWDQSLITATKPSSTVVNQFSPDITWESYRDVQVSSRIRGNRVFIDQLVSSVADAIAAHEYSTDLITSGLAERNAAYWDIMTELGELPETVKAIYAGLKAILTKYLEARRKVATLRSNSISSGSLVGDVASIWMNFRYGIGPIAYSIEDLLNFLYRQGVFSTTRSGENRIFDVNVENMGSLTVHTRDRFWSKVKIDPNHALNGLQTNLFKTAWELVPLSFVIDWVLNIGDLLGSLAGPNGEVDGVTTYSRKCTMFFELPFGGGLLPTQLEAYSRHIINPNAHVGIVINPTMTYKRWLDAAALSWNQVKRDIRNQL